MSLQIFSELVNEEFPEQVNPGCICRVRLTPKSIDPYYMNGFRTLTRHRYGWDPSKMNKNGIFALLRSGYDYSDDSYADVFNITRGETSGYAFSLPYECCVIDPNYKPVELPPIPIMGDWPLEHGILYKIKATCGPMDIEVYALGALSINHISSTINGGKMLHGIGNVTINNLYYSALSEDRYLIVFRPIDQINAVHNGTIMCRDFKSTSNTIWGLHRGIFDTLIESSEFAKKMIDPSVGNNLRGKCAKKIMITDVQKVCPLPSALALIV